MYTGGSQLYSAKEVEHKLRRRGGGGGVGTPEAEPLESVQLQYPPLVLPLDGNYLQCEGRVVFFFVFCLPQGGSHVQSQESFYSTPIHTKHFARPAAPLHAHTHAHTSYTRIK